MPATGERERLRRCYGYAANGDPMYCPNPTGPRSQFWCESCEIRRRDRVGEQLRGLLADAERRTSKREERR
jgi:hypothetical protein